MQKKHCKLRTLREQFTYLPFGSAQRFTYSSGLIHTQTYDQDYRLSNTHISGISNRNYSYDPVNNITNALSQRQSHPRHCGK